MSTRYIALPASGIFTASGAQAANSSGSTDDSSDIPNPKISKPAPAIDNGAPIAIANVSPAVPKTIPAPRSIQVQAAITKFNFLWEVELDIVINNIPRSN